MKILFLPTYCKPEKAASGYLGQNRNEAYAKLGWEMVAFAPTPCRGIDAATRKKYKGKEYRIEKDFDGHRTIYRFPMYAEGKNPVMRALRYFFISVKHLNRALFSKHAKKVDVLFLASTPPYQGLLGATVKKFRKIPFVYNLQDIFPDSLVGTGLAKKNGLLWKIGRRIENCTYRNAEKIIVISQDFKRNIMAKGVPEEKIEVIYNWVDENAITPVKDEDNELFEEFGISRDKFRVVYAGNLGNAQNIRIIVEAAKKLKDNNNIEFVIFGKGSLKNEIDETKAKEQLDNLKIFPIQPYERVSKVYGLGHVCIVACKPGLGGAAMPSKTWSIMSSGRAVLANFDEGELKEILEGESALRQAQGPRPCGVFTKAGDLEGFVAAIEELSQHPEQCTEMGKNGRQFILENLTREVGTQKYVNVIKSVVKL
jgi:glycosyltransferase involved in cell wall biosynthesis